MGEKKTLVEHAYVLWGSLCSQGWRSAPSKMMKIHSVSGELAALEKGQVETTGSKRRGI